MTTCLCKVLLYFDFFSSDIIDPDIFTGYQICKSCTLLINNNDELCYKAMTHSYAKRGRKMVILELIINKKLCKYKL